MCNYICSTCVITYVLHVQLHMFYICSRGKKPRKKLNVRTASHPRTDSIVMSWMALASNQGDQKRLLKSRPKCSPIHFLWKLMHIFFRGKRSRIIFATYFCNFHITTQTKQSNDRRKFAQSGHPASNVKSRRITLKCVEKGNMYMCTAICVFLKNSAKYEKDLRPLFSFSMGKMSFPSNDVNKQENKQPNEQTNKPLNWKGWVCAWCVLLMFNRV
jgi:hypothetical protein